MADSMIITLKNETASLSIDLDGGAIRDFHLEGGAKLNPLSFAFSKGEMPLNNRNGASYKGHFLCLGRWGEPSEGERKAGLPDHGQAANLLWKKVALEEKRLLDMEVECPLEGLQISRKLRLDSRNAAFAVEETICNPMPLGRLYNMVQHPTIAAPFLDENVMISCNATEGFNQFEYTTPGEGEDRLHWPYGRYKALGITKTDLSVLSQPCTSVFSFVVNPADEYGWITAWSARHGLLIGYVWKRTDYPWIHLWQDWDKETPRYLGIEFGTAAFHLPFPRILDTGLELFGEKTTAYLDAGARDRRRYISFLCETSVSPEGASGLRMTGGGSRIALRPGKNETIIETDFKDFI